MVLDGAFYQQWIIKRYTIIRVQFSKSKMYETILLTFQWKIGLFFQILCPK